MSGQRELFLRLGTRQFSKNVLAERSVEAVIKNARLLRGSHVFAECVGSMSQLMWYQSTATIGLPPPLNDRKKPRGGWLPGLFRIAVVLPKGTTS